MTEINPDAEADDPELEPRRRSGGGMDRFLNFVPILGVAACCFFLAQSKDDILYLFRPSEPVDLGGPGAYHMQAAGHGVYAKIRGEVHSEGARFMHGAAIAWPLVSKNGKVWPIKGAPVMLERDSFDELRGSVSADGMLEIDDRLEPQYRPVIASFLKRDQLGVPGPDVGTAHTFVMMMGRTPRSFDRANAWIAGLAALFLFNAWWVVKPMFVKRRQD